MAEAGLYDEDLMLECKAILTARVAYRACQFAADHVPQRRQGGSYDVEWQSNGRRTSKSNLIVVITA